MSIIIKRLHHEQISYKVFSQFRRYQVVTHCWNRAEGCWILKDHSVIRDWTEQELKYVLLDLHRTVGFKGIVSGLFKDEKLIGFSAVESRIFGKLKEYVQLSHLHISYESRKNGYGRRLFDHACDRARDLGAIKLYISALCSKETITFYSNMGCVEAIEYNGTLAALEPDDIQLEFTL